MKKTTHNMTIGYTYEPAHKGAPYTFDGVHYMNGGEFKEAYDKGARGMTLKKDANTPFDKGSDIEETNTSVKSSGATICPIKGETIEEIMEKYFKRVHSTNWDYVTIIDETLVIYNMDAKEFNEFVMTFGKVNERKVVRLKKESAKMIQWLEERLSRQNGLQV